METSCDVVFYLQMRICCRLCQACVQSTCFPPETNRRRHELTTTELHNSSEFTAVTSIDKNSQLHGAGIITISPTNTAHICNEHSCCHVSSTQCWIQAGYSLSLSLHCVQNKPPAYVFFHPRLVCTVSGTYQGPKWFGKRRLAFSALRHYNCNSCCSQVLHSRNQ